MKWRNNPAVTLGFTTLKAFVQSQALTLLIFWGYFREEYLLCALSIFIIINAMSWIVERLYQKKSITTNAILLGSGLSIMISAIVSGNYVGASILERLIGPFIFLWFLTAVLDGFNLIPSPKETGTT